METEYPYFPPKRDDAEEIIREKVERRWDFVTKFQIPIPKFYITCPVCSSTDIQLRYISYHTSENTRKPQAPKYRADVCTKCRECSYAINPFGVILFDITPEDYKRIKKLSPVRYDQVLDLIEKHG